MDFAWWEILLTELAVVVELYEEAVYGKVALRWQGKGEYGRLGRGEKENVVRWMFYEGVLILMNRG